MEKEKTYIAIDLKSFYASVECVEKLATGNFFEDYVVKIIHLWGAFSLEKSAPHPCEKAL